MTHLPCRVPPTLVEETLDITKPAVRLTLLCQLPGQEPTSPAWGSSIRSARWRDSPWRKGWVVCSCQHLLSLSLTLSRTKCPSGFPGPTEQKEWHGRGGGVLDINHCSQSKTDPHGAPLQPQPECVWGTRQPSAARTPHGQGPQPAMHSRSDVRGLLGNSKPWGGGSWPALRHKQDCSCVHSTQKGRGSERLEM